MTPNENLSKHHVARMVDGVPVIISGQVSYATFGEARQVAYDLAMANPGEHFQTLETANLEPLIWAP